MPGAQQRKAPGCKASALEARNKKLRVSFAAQATSQQSHMPVGTQASYVLLSLFLLGSFAPSKAMGKKGEQKPRRQPLRASSLPTWEQKYYRFLRGSGLWLSTKHLRHRAQQMGAGHALGTQHRGPEGHHCCAYGHLS